MPAEHIYVAEDLLNTKMNAVLKWHTCFYGKPKKFNNLKIRTISIMNSSSDMLIWCLIWGKSGLGGLSFQKF